MPSNASLDEFELDRLIKVAASEAIGAEDKRFTPWLATHVEMLSDCINVPLTVGQGGSTGDTLASHTEVSVGNFRLDILAKTQDGRTVVIENQYGRSDHSHLGQVITYASGVQADVVIWIAEEFTEPHLEALRWLNRRTDQDCGAFAVELSFFRIGYSAPAPRLICLEEPSEWSRGARKATVAASHWTEDEFLSVIDNDEDLAKIQFLFHQIEEVGGRVYFGKRPLGYVALHPLPDQHATLGLAINSKGQVVVSGLWRFWKDTQNDPAYQDIAAILGQSHEGVASTVPLHGRGVDALWSAAVASAKKLGEREMGSSE